MARNDDDENPEFDLADLIRDIGHGATNRKGSTLLADLLKACQMTGKKGRLVLDFAISAGQDGIAEIRASLKTSKPEPPLPGGNYYVTKDGALVTEDPRQTALPLPKVVPNAPVIKMTPNGGNAS